MKKVKFMAMLLVATAMSVNFTACSDDDENEGDGGGSNTGTGTGLSIVPPSIVDGVRVAGITTSDNNSAISIDYNDDGSINSATMQGLTYNFEYSESRADKKLIRIKADIKYSDEGYEAEYNWVAENFVEGANGFVISYTSKVNYSESEVTDDWRYSATSEVELNAKFTYNAEGRVTSMKQTGTESYTDTEDGSVSGDVDFAFEYSYNSGMLISSTGTYNVFGEWSKQTFNYGYNGSTHTNTYNNFTPQLAAGIADIDPIAYILSICGYLGNASAVLPTSVTTNYIESDDDPGEDSEEVYGIEYSFDAFNRIDEIKQYNNSWDGYILYKYNYR